MVRLEFPKLFAKYSEKLNFNSSMVRLECAYSIEVKRGKNSFQFLNGAIRIISLENHKTDITKFQFLNGAIRITTVTKKVNDIKLFQFLNGAIRIISTFTFAKGICLISIPQWCD